MSEQKINPQDPKQRILNDFIALLDTRWPEMERSIAKTQEKTSLVFKAEVFFNKDKELVIRTEGKTSPITEKNEHVGEMCDGKIKMYGRHEELLTQIMAMLGEE